MKGLGGGVTYTLAKSRDNASSIGGGGSTVAQDDQNLDAEWGLSSFDRRHQLSANLNVELPFGANRRWLAQPGLLQSLFGDWRFTATYALLSGTPLTPRVAARRDAMSHAAPTARCARTTMASGAAGRPEIDRFFNTSGIFVRRPARSAPLPQHDHRPGSSQLNAQFSRDLRMHAHAGLTVQLNATNLLNTVTTAASTPS